MTRAERLHVDELLKEFKRLHGEEAELRKRGAPAQVLEVFAHAKAERLALIRTRLGVAA